MVQDGLTLAGYHIESGTRKFADYSKAMIDDFGEAIRPYLRSFYEPVRYYPGFDTEGMSTPEEIDSLEPSAEEEDDGQNIPGNDVEKPDTGGIPDPDVPLGERRRARRE